MNNSRFISLTLMIGIFVSAAFGQSNGTLQLSPSTITGGGNTTSNGSQSITGSIGQSPLGTTANGPFVISGGLFSINAIPFKFGDVNSDQTITITDLVDVANFIAGNIPANSPSFNKAAADVDLDGTITITDLVILANFLAGNIHSLPVGH
ncbi:MAG TPA: dockerin type I repeat-containing protein [Blastocatellia bacterium]|nr:dockerin type I repeat-containing protein [Blastocatellia bacterium]